MRSEANPFLPADSASSLRADLVGGLLSLAGCSFLLAVIAALAKMAGAW